MNPLSFVTVFTFGELGTMGVLALALHGGGGSLTTELHALRPSMLWLFLGGFCWVIGDLFQQYATKYIGIGRAIPLSNTNQLWGLAWGAFVFGEFAHTSLPLRILVLGASAIMILGALAITAASAPVAERESCLRAIGRECEKYRLDTTRTIRAFEGLEPEHNVSQKRPWWDLLILGAAAAIFAWLALDVHMPPIPMHLGAATLLSAILLVLFLACGWMLWKQTRFS
jgi:drug/metabolite transporter (DMT)-like permease